MPIEKQPDEITPVNVNAILMPNGEVIYLGKTVGLFDKLKKYLTIIKE